MVVRFFAMVIAVAMMASGMTACGGGGMNVSNAGNGGGSPACDDSDGTPCVPDTPPPTCAFPTGIAPALVSPANYGTVSAAALTQITISDTDSSPYRRTPWMLVVSTDSNPADFFDNTSPYVKSTTLTPVAGTSSESATLPRNALTAGNQYFVFVVTSGCSAAGPIGQFSTT